MTETLVAILVNIGQVGWGGGGGCGGRVIKTSNSLKSSEMYYGLKIIEIQLNFLGGSWGGWGGLWGKGNQNIKQLKVF